MCSVFIEALSPYHSMQSYRLKTEGFSGMTTPWEFNKLMENLFEFKRTTNDYEGELVEWIEKALKNKDKVALLINSDGFFGGINQKINQGSKINVPTHYIQVLKIEKRPKNKVYLEIWHWGFDLTDPNQKKKCQIEIPISQLNQMTHFYGSWK